MLIQHNVEPGRCRSPNSLYSLYFLYSNHSKALMIHHLVFIVE